MSNKNTQQDICIARMQKDIEYIKEQLMAILEQTKKTNGSVADVQKWRNTLTGAFVVVNAIVVPILLWLVYTHLQG